MADNVAAMYILNHAYTKGVWEIGHDHGVMVWADRPSFEFI